ncbi:MAG: hypothetical protein ACR2O4_09120, partial [Hyphomicrobiaceae bacterium]
VGLRDRIDLFWNPAAERGATLRIAIDGPVSKPAQLVSITDDSVSAVVMTSDQDTTRSWLFTINFRQEQVMASGISSNTGGMKGQMMALSCSFEETGVSSAQAADSWRRCCSSE